MLQHFIQRQNGELMKKSDELRKIEIKQLLLYKYSTPNPTSQSQTLPLPQRVLSTAIILTSGKILNKIIVWVHNKKTYRISGYDCKNY